MNKQLISLAVAAAIAAPTAAMAEATLYGRLGVSLDYQSVDNAIPPVFEGTYEFAPGTLVIGTAADGTPIYNTQEETLTNVVALNAVGQAVPFIPGENFKGWGMNQKGRFMEGAGPSNRVGVKGSEDLGNGLKAIYQLEFGVNLASADNNIPSGNNGGVSIRNSFVGLAGNWGTLLLGRHDSPLKISTGKLDLFADTMADYNGTVGFTDLRLDNTTAYISPSFSGFSFAAAITSSGGGTAGAGPNINSDQIAGAWSAALIYNNGPFYASAAYESLNSEMFMNSDTSLAGERACFQEVDNVVLPTRSCDYVDDDQTQWRLGLGILDWNGFTLTAIYANEDHLPGGQTRQAVDFVTSDGYIVNSSVPNGTESQQLWQVQAGYAFGNNMFKAMYGAVIRDDTRLLGATRDEPLAINNISGLRAALSDDLSGDRSTWAVGFDHNFSKRTKAYVLYTAVDDNNENQILGSSTSWDGFSLGMVHKF